MVREEAVRNFITVDLFSQSGNNPRHLLRVRVSSLVTLGQPQQKKGTGANRQERKRYQVLLRIQLTLPFIGGSESGECTLKASGTL